MEHIFKRRTDGVHIINLKKTWEKLMLAARAIATIENPEDVFVVSSRPYGQRAVLKFARYIGTSSMLIPQPGLSILLFLATTRETSPLDSCGGFWPVKFCVFVVPFPVNCNGMLCRICSFTAILK